MLSTLPNLNKFNMIKRFLFLLIQLCINHPLFAKTDIYLFLGGSSAVNNLMALSVKQIKGAQIIYPWRELEPKPGIYDFTRIKADLKLLSSMNKSLFIQIQDKSFTPKNIPAPKYIYTDLIYKGGIVKQSNFPDKSSGWVVKLWVSPVNQRFQLLLKELAKNFDGKISGINLTETAIDLDNNNLPDDYSCDLYFKSVISNMTFLKNTFHQSKVLQYVNFFPCEWNNSQHYMSQLFKIAKKNHIALGGPDSIPFRKSQMENSYPYFQKYHETLPFIAMAIQEPDYGYINPKTGLNFTAKELYIFAKNYLGANIIFWNIQEPQFTQQVLPLLTSFLDNEKNNWME